MSGPPRLPIRMLEAALGARGEGIVGDLVEEWAELRRVLSAPKADAWLWLQAVRVMARLGPKHLRERRSARPNRREDGMIEVLKSGDMKVKGAWVSTVMPDRHAHKR